MARSDFTTPRLFVDVPLGAGQEVPLDKAQGNYLRNVLRLPAGADVLVFNGRDGEWRASLGSAGKLSRLTVAARARPQSPAPDLVYAFALLKHARLDYMVQKAVEMGAGVLQPLVTQHTQVTRVNHERMRANVVEAAEQCGVLHLPVVRDAVRLDSFVAQTAGTIVFCDEEADVADPVAALQTAARTTPVTLVIGPEGGFDARERALLAGRPSVVRLSLGPRILRADTAAVAALAIVQATLGDWGGGASA
jgi:16S rRNA (uracil1498-N3)-methyltransferase